MTGHLVPMVILVCVWVVIFKELTTTNIATEDHRQRIQENRLEQIKVAERGTFLIGKTNSDANF